MGAEMTFFRNVELSLPYSEADHLRFLTFKSPALGGRGDVTLFVPVGDHRGVPLVVLLHGVYGSHWAWAFQGGAHRTALRLMGEGRIRPMVLAMPSDGLWGDESGYVPHAHGDYERWIMEDVAGCVRDIVPGLGPDLFLAGLSMGGYAALRLGAKYGRLVKGVSAHSAITRLNDMARFVEEPPGSYLAEEPFVGVWIARHRATLPPIRFDCGTDDPLLAASRRLHEELVRQNIPHHYEEFPGAHDWTYWGSHLTDTLIFFEECLRGAGPSSSP